jgi:transcriptional regulator with XRE-family HTH domain
VVKDVRALFGKRVRELREAQHLSQEELAFRTGLHRTYVSSVERGQRNVSLLNIYKLAHWLDVEARDLMPSEADVTGANSA